jgi:catechol 2,3-dioxygenase-like lactoylglutathione lyase family enzyme
MDLKLSHSFLYVHDQDAAIAFYRDVVGLEVRTDAPMGEDRWVTVSPPSQPEIEIGLLAIGPPVVPEPDREPLKALLAKGSLGSLIFWTDDVDKTFEELRAAGAEVLQEPIDQGYAKRDCAFRDPSGNMVRFAQRL